MRATAKPKFYMFSALNVAAGHWHASKMSLHNKPIVKLLKRAKSHST